VCFLGKINLTNNNKKRTLNHECYLSKHHSQQNLLYNYNSVSVRPSDDGSAFEWTGGTGSDGRIPKTGISPDSRILKRGTQVLMIDVTIEVSKSSFGTSTDRRTGCFFFFFFFSALNCRRCCSEKFRIWFSGLGISTLGPGKF
jgi:hypothetical protein